jgi:2-dehydro-3-deoxyphosphogluconate aldolase/(4S)-4-hydroxy-2-oxoglutarate aldolase
VTPILEQIERQRIVPILRTEEVEDALLLARACARAGMNVVELTHTTRRVEEAVRALSAEGLSVGVGTVTSAEQVSAAAQAGARFVVSFARPRGMVATAGELGLAAIPGALTPTEIEACLAEGAPAVKLFPARAVEPGYLRDVRAVMPGLRAMVTGGLRATPESIGPWLEAGAIAVGLGGELGRPSDGAAEVERRARLAVAVAEALTPVPTPAG